MSIGRRACVLLAVCLAAFVINLDTTIVNVALPSLVRELNASTTDLEWVVDAYNLVFAAMVLTAGSLSDRQGRKGALILGLAIFGGASLAGSFSGTAAELVAARAVMGLGAAIIFPATLSLISNVFTERGERALAIGLWGATTGIGIALGPIVGGWLLEHYAWGSIFVLMAPVAAVVAALSAVVVPPSRDSSAPPVDWSGLGLSALGMGALVFTVIEAPSWGWTSVATLAGFAGGTVILSVFAMVERGAEHPMLDVGLFKNLRFSAASGSVTVSFFALNGFIFLITQYFQFLKDYSPLTTGVRLLPVATSVAVSSLVGTRLAVRTSTKAVVTAGLVCLTAAFVWISTSAVTTSYAEIVGQMLVLGTGMGLTSAPATEAIMGVVPRAKAGVGSAVNDATRLLGGTLGVAVIGSVFASLYTSRLNATLPAGLPPSSRTTADGSVGGALAVAQRLFGSGLPRLANQVDLAAIQAFLHGFQVGCLVASGVVAVGALWSWILLPARPTAVVVLRHLPSADGELVVAEQRGVGVCSACWPQALPPPCPHQPRSSLERTVPY